MAHFAQINDDNVVVNVIVAELSDFLGEPFVGTADEQDATATTVLQRFGEGRWQGGLATTIDSEVSSPGLALHMTQRRTYLCRRKRMKMTTRVINDPSAVGWSLTLIPADGCGQALLVEAAVAVAMTRVLPIRTLLTGMPALAGVITQMLDTSHQRLTPPFLIM